jgi:SAM-dependent methyltransferase
LFQDVSDLNHFYHTPLGETTRLLLRQRIREMWPDIRGQSLLGLGFAAPYLEQFQGEAERVVNLMPAGQGIIRWPSGKANLTALGDEAELPLQDFSIDRILMVHGLEGSDHPGDMLAEAWRVLSGGGRLLLVVPNRRSLWAQTEKTPFGFGQPYSAGQATRLLRLHSFTPLRTARGLCFLPFSNRSWLQAAPGWELLARRWLPGLAGALLIEAQKQLYGARPVGIKRQRRLSILPVPHTASREAVHDA